MKPASVTTISTLIDYQPDAVVSSEILHKSGGIVTLFAFAENQGLSEHSSPFDALVQIVEGKMEITISGHRHRVAAGELIIMPANEPHALHALSATKMLLTMLKSKE